MPGEQKQESILAARLLDGKQRGPSEGTLARRSFGFAAAAATLAKTKTEGF